MGARIEGKKKKKSIKANVTSKFGSKRKASRMGKKVKKGEMGPSTEFITRSAALKKLQITLKDFRRLCILKGVYPRVPVKAPKGSDKVYYDIKDISYIMHEPLLHKFREFKSFMKKIRKASGRNEFEEARRKNELKPKITLNHLIKERYPRFIDALRDLDDALCMIHLFAALPSAGRITADRTASCSQLSRHWQYYISKSRSLHKVFISIKGVYYQAEIMGEPINWLMPHKFTQAIPKEVDIRVMLTFLEFYEVFVKFVLFKLYHLQGMQYPPTIDNQLDEAGCFLLAVSANQLNSDTNNTTGAITQSNTINTSASNKKNSKPLKISENLPKILESIDSKIDEMEDEDDQTGFLAEPLEAALFSGGERNSNIYLNDEDEDEERLKTFSLQSDDPRIRLFSGLVFFVNREVPLDWLQLCTTAFGGKVGWDGLLSPFKADDPRITHQVVDRPMQGIHPTREYIQPQWVFDSINAKLLLPITNYRIGSKLPPHLSPFVDDEKEGYMPRYREEIRKLQQAANIPLDKSVAKKPDQAEEMEEEDDEEVDEKAYVKGLRSEKQGKNTEEDDDDDDDDDEDDEADDKEQQQQQQNSNTTDNKSSSKGVKGIVYQPKQAKVTQDEEDKELSKIMMSKKSKRLYGRMQHGIQQKQDKIDLLEKKRKLAEEPTITNGETGKGKKSKGKNSKK